MKRQTRLIGLCAILSGFSQWACERPRDDGAWHSMPSGTNEEMAAKNTAAEKASWFVMVPKEHTKGNLTLGVCRHCGEITSATWSSEVGWWWFDGRGNVMTKKDEDEGRLPEPNKEL